MGEVGDGGDSVSGCRVLLHCVSGITSMSEERSTLQENTELPLVLQARLRLTRSFPTFFIFAEVSLACETSCASLGDKATSQSYSYQSGSQVVASLSVSSSSSIPSSRDHRGIIVLQ